MRQNQDFKRRHFAAEVMHETDFAIVFQINQEQNKIRGFHYILDSEAVADAWRNKPDPAAHRAARSARGG